MSRKLDDCIEKLGLEKVIEVYEKNFKTPLYDKRFEHLSTPQRNYLVKKIYEAYSQKLDEEK